MRRYARQLLALGLAAALLASLAGCKKSSTVASQTTGAGGTTSQAGTATPSPTPVATPTPTPTVTPTPTPKVTPTPTPTATPTATPAPAASFVVGTYEKNAGSASAITLQITSVTSQGAAFSLDAKGIAVSGTAAVQSDGTLLYSGSDCTLAFAAGTDKVTITEKSTTTPTVSFAGSYALSK